MVWNTGKSILGTGDTATDVEHEADVIFSAAFIGTTLIRNDAKGQLAWRVDMEPNTDSNKNRDARTADDRAAMKGLNDACSKVNHVIRSFHRKDMGGVGWGLTPTFDRGGMICAGSGAGGEYAKVNPDYAKVAYRYLTASEHSAKGDQRAQDMYIGRGAYCGLVLDDDGNAVTAMSTIRTTLNQGTRGVGARWRPPSDAEVRTVQYEKAPQTTTWGVIGGIPLQADLQQQGMRFYPQQDGKPMALDVNTDIVGYTHGMIRSIYETSRIGQGTAFEMSIGADTFKLASCMSCSMFMTANGVDASSTHLGKGESWVPYYSGESHNHSHYPDKLAIGEAIDQCNAKHARFMHEALTRGVAALEQSPDWVNKTHAAALRELGNRLKEKATDANTVARDLYLDAMTYHKSDLQRLNRALVYGKDARRFCRDGEYDWCRNASVDPDSKGIWDTWTNPYTDDEIKAMHTAPDSLIGS